MKMSFRLFAAAVAALISPFAASPADAQQNRNVVVYTAFADAVNALAPVFKARTGYDIQVVAAGSGEISRRLQAESGRPLADAVISVGGQAVDGNPNLFARYTPREDATILPTVKVSPNWTPFSVTLATVLAVNTRLVPADQIPTTWRELADPKWKGKIAFAGADRSGSALQQLLQIIHSFGERDGWPLFEKMMDNFVITGSSTAVVRGAAQGEYAMALTLEDGAQRFIDGGSPLKIVYPKEGISFAADAMALVARGPNPEGGRALIDFIVSKEGQAILVEKFGRRSVRGDVPGPKSSPEVATLPINNFTIQWENEKSKPFLDRYLQLARR
jgi:iron(III) transport system substrate-binding protein